jgi:mono/diheme cytochrome c family protein
MAESRLWGGVLMVVSCLLLDVAAFAAPPVGQSDDAKQFDDQVRPLLVRHCVECHRGEKPKGNLRLDNLTPDFTNATTRKQWSAVVERVRAGEMPPKNIEKPRPTEQEVKTLTDWLSARVTAADAAARGAQGRVVLRRLNRAEYENTVNDLLGINVSLKEQLPQDGSADGFDNAAAANHTSSFLMEKYLEAADTALNMAIANHPKAPASTSKRYSLKDGHPVRNTTEDVYRFLPDGEVVCFCSSEWHNVGATQFYPQDAGNYRFRISASSIQSDNKPVTFRVTSSGTRLTGKSGLVGYFDAPPNKPTVFEFVRYMEPRTTITMLPYGLAGANTVKMTGAEKWTGPGLAVQYIEVEGPLNETWPPESHRRLFGDMPQKTFAIYNFRDRVEVVSDQPLVDAERILTTFARRAFRRTVTAEDVAPFVAIVKAKLAADYTFELAMRAALKGVLISPEFLFLRERPGTLDDFALASRLSYFLWNTMPDEELLALAEKGALTGTDKETGRQGDGEKRQAAASAMLRQQVERMLKHPKAANFTENFVGQWLGIREIDATEPSHIVYPEFDHLLKVSMIRETELFFDEVLKHDLSLANFVASDFTMLNGRLGKHYGIPGLTGWEFHKTPLPPDSHRGGVLTMASVMKVTANGTTTSPVMRGAWVLDRILGTPPSPPPEGVSAIDPDIRGATTIREQLAKHRSVESCGACHRKIDPPGFALESFDCIGGWREKYRISGWRRDAEEVILEGRKMPYYRGLKVDPSDVTEDGQPFQNIDEFRKLLLRDKDQLARALATKLVTYATGGAPTKVDRPEIEAIVARVRDKNYGFRSLVHEVVQSELFQNK